MTRDLVPIVSGDTSVTVGGVTLPLHAVTLDQLRALEATRSRRTN